mmetsp:Transcript_124595/g.215959  ORF Transcript_124595/g.215959 Transcript_124595/m.215959 type:complete len:269 (+) Transcript_124595:1315-2121(+)
MSDPMLLRSSARGLRACTNWTKALACSAGPPSLILPPPHATEAIKQTLIVIEDRLHHVRTRQDGGRAVTVALIETHPLALEVLGHICTALAQPRLVAQGGGHPWGDAVEVSSEDICTTRLQKLNNRLVACNRSCMDGSLPVHSGHGQIRLLVDQHLHPFQASRQGGAEQGGPAHWILDGKARPFLQEGTAGWDVPTGQGDHQCSPAVGIHSIDVGAPPQHHLHQFGLANPSRKVQWWSSSRQGADACVSSPLLQQQLRTISHPLDACH